MLIKNLDDKGKSVLMKSDDVAKLGTIPERIRKIRQNDVTVLINCS